MKIFGFALTILFFGGSIPHASAQNTSDAYQLKGFSAAKSIEQRGLEQMLINMHRPETYRKHLFELTRVPNVAGTPENRQVIDYMSHIMKTASMDVQHYDYDVWLPDPGTINITITSPEIISLPNKEIPLESDLSTIDSRLHHGYNAYSGSGNVTAEVVYANFGRREDFQKLKELGVDVTGKIVLARYGGNFRGFKAKFAEEAGAAGLIIFTDPANGGFKDGDVYPDGRYSNEYTIQRGSLLTMDYFGDPLTPFQPALPLDGDTQIERLSLEEVPFHTIPVAPIGYGAAEEILSRMTTGDVPSDWQGGLPYAYKLEGGSKLTVNLEVDQPADFKRITNVIGTFEGSEFPDEWIILGSHFDAWGFGATDPNSGTAMLLTFAESLGELVQNGYRPKRSIMIAHWDAEEFLIIGSSEWVEQIRADLMANAVIYLNADMSVTGANFGSSAAPSLKSAIIEATKVVPHPDIDGTVFDQWYRDTTRTEPNIGSLGGGSDHVPLYMHAGVPSAGMSISSAVPVYHSNYDTFTYYERFLDSKFVYGPTLAGVYAVVATRFANADILPYDLLRYGSDLKSHVETLDKMAFDLGIELNLTELNESIENLTIAAALAEVRLKNLIRVGQLETDELTALNQQMIDLEKAFLHEDGMPFGRWFHSLYASIDPFSGYASWMLPGLRYAVTENTGTDQINLEIERIRQAVDKLTDQISAL